MSDILPTGRRSFALAFQLAGVRLRDLAARVDLKTRLSLFIGLLLGAVLVLAIFVVLGNSRRSVAGEIDAVMRLASNLLDEGALPDDTQNPRAILPGLLTVLDNTRHLCVELAAAPLGDNARPCPAAIDDSVPVWFAAHITAPPRELRRVLIASTGVRMPLVVRSDPAEEILEAWREARPLLLLIVLIGFLTNTIVVITVWRAFRPVELIRDALQRIGRGELHPGLPRATTPEFRGIVDGMAALGARLEQARSDNRRLLRHSLEMQENERRAIARELHDEIGQSLAAMDAEAALLQQRAAADLPDLLQATRGIREGIATLYDGLHSLLARLRPAGLDEFGLGPALQNLVADWSQRCPAIRFELQIDLERVGGDPLVQVYLYRIAQEALTNATRHADARCVSLMLCRDAEQSIQLRIADDGRGMAVPDARRVVYPIGGRSGLGLVGMAERAETLGAILSIDSGRGVGTCISVCLPSLKR